MSHSPHQPIDDCTTHFHDRRDFDNMDLEEWLKHEDEQWENIERYEAALNDQSKHVIPNVPAPKGFLAPQVSVLEGFLVPQVIEQQKFVESKTSTTSHAKKDLTHSNVRKEKRKRESIHDIDLMLHHPIDQQNSVPINSDPHYIEQRNLMSDLDLAVHQFFGKQQA